MHLFMSLNLRRFMPATTRAKRKTNLVRMCNASVAFERTVLKHQVWSSSHQSLRVFKVVCASCSSMKSTIFRPIDDVLIRCIGNLVFTRWIPVHGTWLELVPATNFVRIHQSIRRKPVRHTLGPAGHILPSPRGSDSCILSDSLLLDDCDRRQQSLDP